MLKKTVKGLGTIFDAMRGERKPLISIIIPVYNSERYLRQCLDSLVCQTMKQIEIICVDDGSSDGSFSILQEYVARDKRIFAVKSSGKGAGAARNDGITLARGGYLLFLDSDDFFSPLLCRQTYKAIKKYDADVCIFNAQLYYEESGEYKSAGYMLRKEFCPGTLPFEGKSWPYIFNLTLPNPWTKLIKKSFVDSFSLRFQELPRTNDLYFIFMSLILAGRITILNEVLVNYRKRIGSLQATNDRSPLAFYKAFKSVYEELERRGLFSQTIRSSFFNLILNSTLYNLFSLKKKSNFVAVYELLNTDFFPSLGITDFSQVRIFDYNKKNFQNLQYLLSVPVEQYITENGLHFTGENS